MVKRNRGTGVCMGANERNGGGDGGCDAPPTCKFVGRVLALCGAIGCNGSPLVHTMSVLGFALLSAARGARPGGREAAAGVVPVARAEINALLSVLPAAAFSFALFSRSLQIGPSRGVETGNTLSITPGVLICKFVVVGGYFPCMRDANVLVLVDRWGGGASEVSSTRARLICGNSRLLTLRSLPAVLNDLAIEEHFQYY